MEVNLPTVIVRQCEAKNREGLRCSRHAMNFQKYCASHGGMAPQNMAAAYRLMLQAREPAIVVLQDKYINNDQCDPALRLKAIQMVLDRTGFGPSATMKVTHSEASEYADMSTQELVARAELIVQGMRVHGAIEAQVISSEVVSEDADLNPGPQPENPGSHLPGDRPLPDGEARK